MDRRKESGRQEKERRKEKEKESGRQKVRRKPSVCPQVIVTRRWRGMSFYLCESVSVSDHCLWHLFFRCLSLESNLFLSFFCFHSIQSSLLPCPAARVVVPSCRARTEGNWRESERERLGLREKEKVNVVTSWCYPSLLIMSNDPPSLLILYWVMIHRLLIPSSPKSL